MFTAAVAKGSSTAAPTTTRSLGNRRRHIARDVGADANVLSFGRFQNAEGIAATLA